MTTKLAVQIRDSIQGLAHSMPVTSPMHCLCYVSTSVSKRHHLFLRLFPLRACSTEEMQDWLDELKFVQPDNTSGDFRQASNAHYCDMNAASVAQAEAACRKPGSLDCRLEPYAVLLY